MALLLMSPFIAGCSRGEKAPPISDQAFVGETAGEERALSSLKMAFCWCPPGTFMMGSPRHEPGRDSDEDQVEVTLTQGFWMGKYEVTQSEYRSLMGENPSFHKGERWPVERVLREDAARFCRKLTKTELAAGRLPKSWEYRLPTEAQWEYACRAGSTTAYTFGDDFERLIQFGRYTTYKDDRTGEVGQKQPNAWGLCDMHGNVWEWCLDRYQAKLPGGEDPHVIEGSHWVARGGSAFRVGKDLRSASRERKFPDFEDISLGFRVVAAPTDLHPR